MLACYNFVREYNKSKISTHQQLPSTHTPAIMATLQTVPEFNGLVSPFCEIRNSEKTGEGGEPLSPSVWKAGRGLYIQGIESSKPLFTPRSDTCTAGSQQSGVSAYIMSVSYVFMLNVSSGYWNLFHSIPGSKSKLSLSLHWFTLHPFSLLPAQSTVTSQGREKAEISFNEHTVKGSGGHDSLEEKSRKYMDYLNRLNAI